MRGFLVSPSAAAALRAAFQWAVQNPPGYGTAVVEELVADALLEDLAAAARPGCAAGRL